MVSETKLLFRLLDFDSYDRKSKLYLNPITSVFAMNEKLVPGTEVYFALSERSKNGGGNFKTYPLYYWLFISKVNALPVDVCH